MVQIKYFFICIIFTFPIFSQNDSALKKYLDGDKIYADSLKITSPEFLEKLKELFKEKSDEKYKIEEDKVKIIPIPPATAENSKFEWLPLYREGERKFRLLNLKNLLNKK